MANYVTDSVVLFMIRLMTDNFPLNCIRSTESGTIIPKDPIPYPLMNVISNSCQKCVSDGDGSCLVGVSCKCPRQPGQNCSDQAAIGYSLDCCPLFALHFYSLILAFKSGQQHLPDRNPDFLIIDLLRIGQQLYS